MAMYKYPHTKIILNIFHSKDKLETIEFLTIEDQLNKFCHILKRNSTHARKLCFRKIFIDLGEIVMKYI